MEQCAKYTFPITDALANTATLGGITIGINTVQSRQEQITVISEALAALVVSGTKGEAVLLISDIRDLAENLSDDSSKHCQSVMK